MIFSTFDSALKTFIIWSSSHKFWFLVIYSLYGATLGGDVVLRPRFATKIVGHDQNKEQSLLIFDILTAMRRFVIVASSFIFTAQFDEGAVITNGYRAHKWLRIIVYTDVIMIVANLKALGFFIPPTLVVGEKRKVKTKAKAKAEAEADNGYARGRKEKGKEGRGGEINNIMIN